MAAETKIVISQIPPYDGEYEMDFDQPFSAREWRWLKKLSEGELRPGSMTTDDLRDPDFVIALAAIAMFRAGKITREQVLLVADELSDAPLDDAHIDLILPEVEAEVVPPALTTEPTEPSVNDSVDSENSKRLNESNGGSSSRSVSGLSVVTPARTGLTRLGTSSPSAPARSTT